MAVHPATAAGGPGGRPFAAGREAPRGNRGHAGKKRQAETGGESLAQRLTAGTGKGMLREAAARGGGGVAIYAVGNSALLLVIGDQGLDSTRLHRESRATVEALERIIAAARPSAPEVRPASVGSREFPRGRPAAAARARPSG